MSLLQIRILAAALVLAAILGGIWGYGHHQHTQGLAEGDARTTARYEAALTKQKAQAQAQLDAALADKARIEAEYAHFKTQQESKDATNQTTVEGLRAQLRAAAGAAGRLRDPNAARCGPSSDGATPPPAGPTGDSAGYPAQATGLLSAQLTGLLEQLTSEADAINLAYASCRAERLHLDAAQALTAPGAAPPTTTPTNPE
jgi:hypothetical protein